MWVILWPRPTMMPDSIGTIGNMHGVKASSNPAPKKNDTISQKLPCLNSLAICEFSLSMVACDEVGEAARTSCVAAGRGVTVTTGAALAPAAMTAGRARWMVLLIGG